jgi:hypothetical protein
MKTRSALLFLVVLTLTLSTATNSISAGGPKSKGRPKTPQSHGKSYAEWSAVHWQWLYSLPVDAHPLFDTAEGSAGQSGKVWFIGGTYSSVEVGPGTVLGEADRTLTIPSGTALFFPLINAEASTIEGNGETEEELREAANFFADFVDPDSVFLEIDGHDVDVSNSRVESPLFEFGPLPANNVLAASGYDAPEGAISPSVADGYYAFVPPLSVGTHTLHFGGEADITSVGGPLFILDIRYTIRVVPRGRY